MMLLLPWVGVAAAEAPVAASPVTVVFVDDSGAEWMGLDHLAVRLVRGAEARPLTMTDTGLFAGDVPAGAWTLDVRGRGFLPLTLPIEVQPGSALALRPRLDLDPDDIETVVVSGYTEAARLERSAQAVSVVATEEAQTQSADMGEVMARTQGVGVRRAGGLGSESRFSLNGLTDDQVRFFLDGVPLELAGFPFGISNVPVDLVERVEVYKGVVPVRFGADALGGAVNLVSEAPRTPLGGSVSYQGGSFDTHRVAGSAHLAHAGTGLFARAHGFLDASANDYPIDVEVPDEVGHLSEATVRRFHDGYLAGGGSLEVGVADRPWADALSVRGFGSSFARELQNNVVMTVPYGAAHYSMTSAGGTARFRQSSGAFGVDAFVGYTTTETTFVDLGTCVYDWFGQCVRERSQPGELEPGGIDDVVWDRVATARVGGSWRPNTHHAVTLSVAPSWFTRTGEDRLYEGDGRDPLASQRDSFTVVTGLEHQLDSRDERFQNLLFAKHYGQALASEEPLPGGEFRDVDRATQRFGFGDGARLHLADWAFAKVSYEWATRLPTPEEVFGDAVLILDNLDLTPETSHNVNAGVSVEADTGVGEVAGDVNAFLREASDLIVLLGTDRAFTYYNVFSARSLGVEAAAGWTAPNEWVVVELNATWLDFRNTSTEGTFGAYAGDRIPNRPWLFANATVTLAASDVAAPRDRLSLDWYSRYVHAFYRGWESVGLVAFKQTVPSQLSHTVALTYAVDSDRGRVSGSVEVQNLTDADTYDFFGVQRPGRAVYGKLTVTR